LLSLCRWGLVFTIGASIFSICLSTLFLSKWRFQTGKSLGTDVPDVPSDCDVKEVEIPFKKVNVTFSDVHYVVKASTSDEQLELLRGVTGYIEGGMMTALMGSRYGKKVAFGLRRCN
jgi:hypothetical protein